MRLTLFGFFYLLCFANVSCRKDSPNSPTSVTIITSPVTNVTDNSAVSGGKIAHNGKPILARGVCFGRTHNPTVSDSIITVSGDTGVFVCNLSPLSASTTYYVRAFARTDSNVNYGNEQSFKTARLVDSLLTLYGTVGNELYAVNAQTGKLKWQVTLASSFISSPFYADGMIFVGGDDSKLYAFDTTGTQRWAVPINGSSVTTPLVKGGIVYELGGFGTLYAFNMQTGAQIWSVAGPSLSDISLVNGIIYRNSDYLQAVDSKTGAVIWNAPYGMGTPVVAYNRVFTIDARSYQGFQYDANSGALITGFPTGPLRTSTFFQGQNLNVYNGNVYCVRFLPTQGLVVTDTLGSVKWTADLMADPSDYNYYRGPQPYFSDSAAYIFDINRGMVCYNAYTGAFILGPAQTEWRKPGSLTIANGILYYFSDFLYAFDPSTRTILWRMDIERNDSAVGDAPCIVGASGNDFMYDKIFNWK